VKIESFPEIKRVNQTLDFLPFVSALIVLGFMAWTTRLLARYPDDGIYSMQSSGEINLLWSNGPAQGRLQVGDIVLRIDEVPYEKFLTYSPGLGKSTGDVVDFLVLRQGKQVEVSLPLAPAPPALIFDRLASILVALCFWLVGAFIGAYGPSGKSGGVTFILQGSI